MMNNNLNPLTKWTLNDLIEHHVQQIKYIFFPGARDMLAKRPYAKPKKPNLNRFLKTVIVQSMFSDHKIKLEIINDQIFINTSSIWKLNHTFLKDSQVKEKNHKENEKVFLTKW